MKYLLLFFITGSLYAQVNWSEAGTSLERIVKGVNNELITFSFKSDPYSGWKPITPVATRYNKDMQQVLQRALFTTGENVHFHSAYNFRGHVYLFTTWYNRGEKKMILYCTEIDPLTLEVKCQKELNRFDGMDRLSQFDITIKPSRDTSHILVFASSGYATSKPEKMVVQVLDHTMNKDWGKLINLPYASKFVAVTSFEISNAGDVYVLYRHHKQELLRERMNVRVIVSRNYTCKLLVCRRDDTARVEYVPDVQNKFVQDMTLHVDGEDTVHLLALYKDKYRGWLTGHFNIGLNSRTLQTVSNRFEPFPVSRLSDHFKIMGTNMRQDGSIDLLMEENYHYTESDSNSRKEIYNANDIFVINYKKDGSIHYTRVPKWQHEEDHHSFISFKWMNRGNELLLFYNDSEENINRDLSKRPVPLYNARYAAFVMATVNDTGQLKREVLYKDKDFIMFIKRSEVFNSEGLVLYSERYRLFNKPRYRVGTLQIPHNSPAIQ